MDSSCSMARKTEDNMLAVTCILDRSESEGEKCSESVAKFDTNLQPYLTMVMSSRNTDIVSRKKLRAVCAHIRIPAVKLCCGDALLLFNIVTTITLLDQIVRFARADRPRLLRLRTLGSRRGSGTRRRSTWDPNAVVVADEKLRAVRLHGRVP